ncbi:aminotransferase class V-fold PLP-dependent enzyme [bacterium]|nr:aminotransferase class V-fold PLP-dependent enzyme [bacterium]
MKISRRSFLTSAGFSIAATAINAEALQAEKSPPVFDFASANWKEIRDLFDLDRAYIHLSTFYLSSHPKPVREAIERYRREIDRNPFLFVEHALFESEYENLPLNVKKTAAEYLGANPQEIALTTSTTVGLALVYNGMKLRKGQEIVTTEHDHYSHHESIRWAVEKNDATFRKIALFDALNSISEDGIVERIRKAIKPETRALGVTWVHSSSGLKLPLGRIAQAIQDANSGRTEADRILFVVDGVHGLGVEDSTVNDMGCDFLVAGTHKWIFGPRGTGIIWAKNPAWAQISPTIPSFDDPDVYGAWMENRTPQGPTRASWVAPGGFLAYEHQWATADAFGFHLKIGKKRIADRIHELNTLCKDGLAEMKHVKLYTPRSSQLSAGIICFDVDGLRPEQVVEKLLVKKIVASVTPYGKSFARLAPGIMNSEAEVDTALRAIRDLA